MIIEKLAQIATVVGVILVTPQIFIALWSFVSTNKRDRIKSTLDYYEEFNNKIRNIKKEIKLKYGLSITKENAELISKDKEYSAKMKNILNQYERLSIGVNINIYDRKTIKRICGRSLIANFERFKEFIYYRRRIKNANTMYEEFEMLIIQLKQIQTKDH